MKKFLLRTLAFVSLVLGFGLERSCPWPRECLSSERLSLASSLVSSTSPLLGGHMQFFWRHRPPKCTPVAPGLSLSFRAQSSLGGAQFSLGGTSSDLGGHGPERPPIMPGPETLAIKLVLWVAPEWFLKVSLEHQNNFRNFLNQNSFVRGKRCVYIIDLTSRFRTWR